MNKKIVVLILFQLLTLGLVADWQTEVSQYFRKAHEYDKLTKYLETHLDRIPDGEKHLAVILLSYAYNELGDSVNEKKWIIRYFEHYDVKDTDIKFLTPNENVKIFEYQTRWFRKYPKLNSIAVNQNSKKIRYFSSPANLFLDIDIRAPVEIVVKNNRMEVICTRYLHKGTNTIALPFDDNFKKLKENRLYILLRTGAIEINKAIILSAWYEFPPEIQFDPVEANISLKGKQFKKEVSDEFIYETRKYFDKKNFFKKALLHLGIGCVVMAVKGLVIHPQSEQEHQTSTQRAFWNGLDHITAVLTIGVSLKGILHVFKSFKKEKTRKVKRVFNPEAAAFNKELRKHIEAAKSDIFVSYELIIKE